MIAEGLKAVLSNQEQIHVAYLTENKIKVNKTINSLEIDVIIIELSDISRQNFVKCIRESCNIDWACLIKGLKAYSASNIKATATATKPFPI